MSETLRSVGLDVGTTTTQLVISELEIQNQAGAFAVPKMAITERKILYRSPVYFTPLVGQNLVNGAAIRAIVDKEYEKAGVKRESLDTGAVIITGETSRKENARAVLENLSEFAGDFVVATAGPDLESVLAAKGAGAVDFSEKTGKTVLHMDIGGGTSNLALIENGKITATGCLNVGGRLLKFDETGQIIYVSPVVQQFGTNVQEIVEMLVQALEMAAGLRAPDELFRHFWTEESAGSQDWLKSLPDEEIVVSFSGGVADCIEQEHDALAFGDIGPALGSAIRKSRLCRGPYRLGEQTIRATVIGAGCHSAQLSGSTVFYKNIDFPLKNLPVVRVTDPSQIKARLQMQDGAAVLAMAGFSSPDYGQVVRLAEEIAAGVDDRPVFVALEQDMAKALGQAIALRLPSDRPCLCIDSVSLEEGSFLDVAAPVGPALPVVIKTLILGG
ncbi:MAG: ethanolamine ammonia-lyase reactivating factor EutA [Oscillospiraceae bacterium]|nr:ethanolamine ammonia-lyase reactivating factor EutA [Oscillospiraceae bacterium]